MRRRVLWALCVLVVLASADPAMGQANIAILKAKLDNFRDNVEFTLKLIDKSNLKPSGGERFEDLAAFGFVNVITKLKGPTPATVPAAITAITTKRAEELANLKVMITDQIAASCGSPGPKPTKDAVSMTRLRALTFPGFYNRTLIMIVSDGELASLASIGLETELQLGKVFYFPLLKEPEKVALSKLPRAVRDLLQGYLLK